ncbi:MAG: T9SS type A sorting domain-containing protein [candidate division Zixibacteria bacterium]|nr:T9SS type A sorting domain-containing protein [candidate division Zixibacteria bacterium]
MKKYLMILSFVTLLVCDIAVGQHYTDWTGFEYLPGRYDSKDRIVFYELQKDYTIDLTEYFDADKCENLPDCCELQCGPYWSLAYNHERRAVWDFFTYELGGILTVKKGYRWDGASRPCKNYDDNYCPDEYHNFRSSCIHDVLYDLMRMEYHAADHHHGPEIINGTCEDTHILWDVGDDNRRLADMMHYMIAIEDGDPKDDAQSDYFWLRVWGACPTHDDDKLCGWKYHVNELTAYASDGKVELEWNRPNEAEKDPNFIDNFAPFMGYSLQRNGEEIAAIPAVTIPSWITSYTDNDVVNGTTYNYRLLPNAGNKNQDDWSNEEIVIPMDGPGNALLLDGIDDYVEANNASNDLTSNPDDYFLDSWTQEAWVYPEADNAQGVIMAFNTIDDGNINLLSYDAGSQKFCYYDVTNGYLFSNDEFPPNNWYHVALTCMPKTYSNPSNQTILYVNGVPQKKFIITFDDRPHHGAQFSIGQEWDGSGTSQHFKGKIDEVRLWRNVIRTPAQLLATMNIPLKGNEPGLVGLWHFDEPHATNYFRVAHEATSNANDATLMGYAFEDRPFTPSGAMGVATDIADDLVGINQIPENFVLKQNYPNPFNPSTKIEFALPRAEFVTVEIFNILGEKVESLVSKELTAGSYSVTWDAGNISSGIYFYKINAGEFSETKKMTLVK